ncbi:MAG: kelch repeat-containing protein [Planctomycetota bacterium]|nr:kelch repeat-containing protein [Planctomycetota bacterium]
MDTLRLIFVGALLGWSAATATAAPQFVPGPSARVGHCMAYDAQRQVVVLFGGDASPLVAGGALGDTWEWDGQQWAQRSPANAPPPRARGAMAYDAARGVCVYFGGAVGSGHVVNETWEYDGVTWAQVTTAAAPAARRSCNVVYDAVRQRTVLFGGEDGSDLGDTWEYDGVDWVAITAAAPPARAHHSMAFDATRGEVVLFGGGSVTGPALFGDTWGYDGVIWSPRSVPASPGLRREAAMAWLPTAGDVALFGGWNQVPRGDTWAWDGAAWSPLAPAVAPPSRRDIASCMVYDAARGECVLFGGMGATTLGDTWTFDGVAWRPALDFVISPVNGNRYAVTAPMTWQQAEQVAVSSGGHLATIRDPAENAWALQTFGANLWIGLNDLAVEGAYVWSSGELSPNRNWAPGEPQNDPTQDGVHFWSAYPGQWGDRQTSFPTPGLVEVSSGPVGSVAAGAAATVAPQPMREHAAAPLVGGGALTFGGVGAQGPVACTYEWRGAGWQKQLSLINPLPRTGHALVRDELRGNHLMFGGRDPTGGKLADTWTYQGGQWQVRLPPSAPSARSDYAMAYDARTGATLLFGGEDASGARLADLWSWDGVTWRQLTPPTSPPARAGHGLAFDRARGVFVLFGGSDGVARLNDVWEWDGTAWTPVAPAQPGGFSYQPTGRDGFVMVFDARTEHAVVVGGETALGCVDEVWSWDGTGWTRYFADAASVLPSPRVGAAAFADDATGALRLVGGGCGGAALDDLWELRLPLLARVESFGSGCVGSNGVPRLELANGSAPVLGQTLDFRYSNAPNALFITPAILSFGYRRDSYLSQPLPLSLAAVGLPGCTLYHSADLNIPVPVAPGAGQAQWSTTLPAAPAYLGQRFYFQGLHLEFAGGPAWAAMSNALGIRVGAQ